MPNDVLLLPYECRQKINSKVPVSFKEYWTELGKLEKTSSLRDKILKAEIAKSTQVLKHWRNGTTSPGALVEKALNKLIELHILETNRKPFGFPFTVVFDLSTIKKPCHAN